MTDKPFDAAAQAGRFREMAGQLGADEDEAAFKEKLAQIARQKPKAESAPDNSKKKKS